MKSLTHLALAACALGVSLAPSASAAPVISRLTPPSALFSFGDASPPVIARFLPGQRFDLQCTVLPDAGETITSVVFKVNGATVKGESTLTTTGIVPWLPTGTTVGTIRAYSRTMPGIAKLEVIATQSDGQTAAATGNFEIVRMPGGGNLKNVIIMIGDGMGTAHRTAARIMSRGVQQGKANAPLHMDTFPYTGMVQTASLNSIITDSAPGASCYSTGNKAQNGSEGVFPDDTSSFFDNPRVELIGEFLARKRGRALGIVTTADVSDATPGAFGVHTGNRGANTGICDQFLDEAHEAYKGYSSDGAGLKVLLGGGRRSFLPNTVPGSGRNEGGDYVLPADIASGWRVPSRGQIDPGRDLLSEFTTAGFQYAPNGTTLATAAENPATRKLLGLFAFGNMNVAMDKINGPNRRNVSVSTLGMPIVSAYGLPDQPMLDEMTDAALKVLSRDPDGFVLMVEGASIDKQAHAMDTERWILETIEFDRAVGVAKKFAASNKTTLVIVTADHETSGASIIGSSVVTHNELVARSRSGFGTAPGGPRSVVGTYDSAGFPTYTTAPDGYPVTTDINFRFLIGYGANADRFEDWVTNEVAIGDPGGPTSFNTRDAAGGYRITGQVQDGLAVHTGNDIPLSAFGRGSQYFSGYYDNTDVFFRVFKLIGVW